MPAAFDKCRAGGGKIRTKKLDRDHFMRICIPRGGGKSVGGEVRKHKSVTKNSGGS